MTDALLRDLRIAARWLGRNPGFTPVAVLTLAFGIGATTTVFSVVYGVLFRPLPFPNADRLVEVIQVAFTLVSLLACYVPARRARRVDPVVALRSE